MYLDSYIRYMMPLIVTLRWHSIHRLTPMQPQPYPSLRIRPSCYRQRQKVWSLAKNAQLQMEVST